MNCSKTCTALVAISIIVNSLSATLKLPIWVTFIGVGFALLAFPFGLLAMCGVGLYQSRRPWFAMFLSTAMLVVLGFGFVSGMTKALQARTTPVVNEAEGFRLDPPVGWVLERNPDTLKKLPPGVKAAASRTGDVVGLVLVEPIAPDLRETFDLFAVSKAHMDSVNWTDKKLGPMQKFESLGHPTVRYSLTGKDPSGVDRRAESLVLDAGNRLYRLLVIGTPATVPPGFSTSRLFFEAFHLLDEAKPAGQGQAKEPRS